MELYQALALIGVVIVLAVAVSSYDRARLLRRVHKRHPGERPARGPELDINPGPASAHGRRFVRGSDGDSPEPARPESAFVRELESLEQAISRPIGLGPGPAALAADTGNLEHLFPWGDRQGPNPKMDFVIHLPGRGPVLRDQALGPYKQNEYVLEKPRALYGLRYLLGTWSALERDPDEAQYSDLALMLQLVDRRGPVEESELNAFSQLALKLADAFHRRIKLGMTIEQARARALEVQRFVEQYDLIASINVLAGNGHSFPGRSIEQAARQHGMQFGAMNIFHMKNPNSAGCKHLFSMASLYEPGTFDPATLDGFETQGLTLFMTVPCVQDPPRVFEKMARTAKGLAQALGGRLIDQEQRPLTDEGIVAIEREIRRIATEVSAYGITPGSETALRFFNA